MSTGRSGKASDGSWRATTVICCFLSVTVRAVVLTVITIGSGKSTLLALLLGDHPRSFTEDIELFGKPRLSQATATRTFAELPP